MRVQRLVRDKAVYAVFSNVVKRDEECFVLPKTRCNYTRVRPMTVKIDEDRIPDFCVVEKGVLNTYYKIYSLRGSDDEWWF